MNLEFKEQVWKSQFKATEESAAFEEKIRTVYGLQYRYEAARLLIGRSLAEPTPPTRCLRARSIIRAQSPVKTSSGLTMTCG